jgi:hypothetical protein
MERFMGQGQLVVGRARWIGDVQRFLNRGEGNFSWVFDLRILRHLLVRPCLFTHFKEGAAVLFAAPARPCHILQAMTPMDSGLSPISANILLADWIE